MDGNKNYLNNIISRCKRGDIKAQELLYKEYYNYGMSIALRYSKSRENAVEILNDSFLKIFNKIAQFHTEKSFKSWMRRIVINTAIDLLRKEKIVPEPLDDYNTNVVIQNEALNNLNTEDILNIVRELPSQYRIVFNLFQIEGYSHEEISKKLNMNVSTSRSCLARAKNKIKIQLIKYHEFQRV